MTYRLMTPGPVPVPELALKALAQPVLHHRTPEFEAILERVLKRLPKVFVTCEPVYIHCSTGSGAMESAIVNCLSPGDDVLVICAGKFGERWAEIAQIFGMNVIRYNVKWGENPDLSHVQQLLKKHQRIKAVLCQACETSTGAWLPIRELARMTAQHDSILAVDAITALGAAPMPMDEWGLDVVIGGSQKALMLPTGLSFIAFSQKAWRLVESARSPRHYWDIRAEKKANAKNQTRFSSPVSLICALDVILEQFENKGLEFFHRRTTRLALSTRAGLEPLGLKLFPQNPSHSLSCIELPAQIDGQKLRAEMERQFGVTVMGGQDQLSGRVVRVGHMGAISDDDVIAFFEALGSCLHSSQTQQSIDRATQVLRS